MTQLVRRKQSLRGPRLELKRKRIPDLRGTIAETIHPQDLELSVH